MIPTTMWQQVLLAGSAAAFMFAPTAQTHRRRGMMAASMESSSLSSSLSLKESLLASIEAFKEVTARDGMIPVDFGVRGGELESKDRTPRNLLTSGAFANVSTAVGEAAAKVAKAVDVLAFEASLAKDATKFLGTQEGGACPLDGGWRNLWTTAADATFSANSKRGDALVGNFVDGKTGRVTNVITFLDKDRKVDQLRVTIQAKALSKTRVQLTFKKATFVLRKRLLGVFKKIVLPVPAVTFTRIIFAFRPNKKPPPPPYFDVLYLDHDLRIQKTGDGNLFVQRRLGNALL
mmetsp:Transcript_7370/g.24292  ORF Transcript_7370/g.24292 Transcript_7370/m.24292 type:complete len:291 (+) Transcript_7370:39-911(+)